ncbi:uncharacterized protein RJT21DRAFT_138712 [Scheffersomyces amazonensis]|uniref:uncharacterized protein n=1 Tax=Scheffersomyces amazonensis TaxID=1078765 RepID=UPI00315CAA7F
MFYILFFLLLLLLFPFHFFSSTKLITHFQIFVDERHWSIRCRCSLFIAPKTGIHSDYSSDPIELSLLHTFYLNNTNTNTNTYTMIIIFTILYHSFTLLLVVSSPH